MAPSQSVSFYSVPIQPLSAGLPTPTSPSIVFWLGPYFVNHNESLISGTVSRLNAIKRSCQIVPRAAFLPHFVGTLVLPI